MKLSRLIVLQATHLWRKKIGSHGNSLFSSPLQPDFNIFGHLKPEKPLTRPQTRSHLFPELIIIIVVIITPLCQVFPTFLFAHSEKENENLERQLEVLQQQLREKEERLANYQAQVKEGNLREASLIQQLQEKELQRENSERQLQEMEEQIRVKEDDKANLERQLREMAQSFEERTREKEEEKTNLETQLGMKNQELSELETSLSVAQQMIIELRRQESCDWVISRDEVQVKGKYLGKGAWGSVNEATYCGCKVAVKQIHELILSPHNRRLFEREMNIASRCRHPCLLQFIGATNDVGNPLFVTELMELSLRALLEQRQLTETEIYVISLDVSRALNYLHHMKPSPIVHRDVSSANVLLWRQGEQWRGKVSDYGTAKFVQQTMTVAPGALIYSAPEAVSSNQTSKVSFFNG